MLTKPNMVKAFFLQEKSTKKKIKRKAWMKKKIKKRARRQIRAYVNNGHWNAGILAVRKPTRKKID